MLKVLQSRPREHKRPLLQIVGKEAHAIRNILVLRTLSDMHMVSPALPFYIDARFRVAISDGTQQICLIFMSMRKRGVAQS